MRTLTTSLIVVLLLLVPAAAQKGKGKPAAAADSTRITQLKQQIAAELAAFADWCVKNKFPGTAMGAAKDAIALDAENKKASDVAAKAGGDDSTDETALKSLARKRESSGKKLGPAYCELFLAGPANARKEFDAYIVCAFNWDEETTDKWVEVAYKKAHGEKNFALVCAMLTAALPHQKAESKLAKGYPERAKVLRECEARQASQSPLLKKARNHTMQYYLSLPTEWHPDRKWPVLVAVEGAGCNFAGMNGAYGGKNNATYIVITPCGFTNTNGLEPTKYNYPQEVLNEWNQKRMGFDEPGLLAALEDVRADWCGEEKFYITGFSGGGNLTWYFTFKHPEMLHASAPASANFTGHPPDQFSTHEAREKLPVHAFQGEDDNYRSKDNSLDAQWGFAKSLLADHGYKNVQYTLVPKTGHSACREQVLKFFGETMASKEAAAPDAKKK